MNKKETELGIKKEGEQLLSAHLLSVPKQRKLEVRVDNQDGLCIVKPRLFPPRFNWPADLLQKTLDHLQNIWDHLQKYYYYLIMKFLNYYMPIIEGLPRNPLFSFLDMIHGQRQGSSRPFRDSVSGKISQTWKEFR